MNKLAAEQNAIVEAMSKIASANGLPLTYPVAQRIAAIHQYSPVLIMKTAFDITELAMNPAVHSVAGGVLGGGLGALMAPKGMRLTGLGVGAGLGAGAGYFGSPYINEILRQQLPVRVESPWQAAYGDPMPNSLINLIKGSNPNAPIPQIGPLR